MTDREIVQRAFQLVRADLDDDDTIGVLDSLEEAMLAALGGMANVRAQIERPLLLTEQPFAFRCEPEEGFAISDDSGYDRSDPKHPEWHSVHADLWDNREKGA